MNTGARLATKSLALNEIASVNLSTAQPVAFEPYAVNHRLGARLCSPGRVGSCIAGPVEG